MKTFVCFKYNIEMDLDFYVRVCTCKKRLTGKQPNVENNGSTRRPFRCLIQQFLGSLWVI